MDLPDRPQGLYVFHADGVGTETLAARVAPHQAVVFTAVVVVVVVAVGRTRGKLARAAWAWGKASHRRRTGKELEGRGLSSPCCLLSSSAVNTVPAQRVDLLVVGLLFPAAVARKETRPGLSSTPRGVPRRPPQEAKAHKAALHCACVKCQVAVRKRAWQKGF